jgi:hypothetical protein
MGFMSDYTIRRSVSLLDYPYITIGCPPGRILRRHNGRIHGTETCWIL